MSFKYKIGTLEHTTPCRGLDGTDSEGRVARWWANIANITGWDNYDWYFVGAFVNGVQSLDLDVVICPKGDWDYTELLSVLTGAQQKALDEDLMLDIYATSTENVYDASGPGAGFFNITNHMGWHWEKDGRVLGSVEFSADIVTSPAEGLNRFEWNSPSKTNIFPSFWGKLESGVYTKTSQLCTEYFQ
jgi:hypothetical protein|tara:strand:- start:181 stop:744 length:564 start_codon:yes stop_codon:yes gene_type:complete